MIKICVFRSVKETLIKRELDSVLLQVLVLRLDAKILVINSLNFGGSRFTFEVFNEPAECNQIEVVEQLSKFISHHAVRNFLVGGRVAGLTPIGIRLSEEQEIRRDFEAVVNFYLKDCHLVLLALVAHQAQIVDVRSRIRVKQGSQHLPFT